MDSKIKKSYGIAICRNGKDGPEIFMCRKRVTYEFNEFVYGKYDDRNKIYLLVNNMTHQEKNVILTFNFDRMWYQLTLEEPSIGVTFSQQCKRKFENTFHGDMKEYLIDVISVSKDGYKIWEIPKGRPNSWEKPLDTAIREVSEESHFTPNHFKFIFHKKYVFTTIDYGVTYRMYYFMAKFNEDQHFLSRGIDWHHEEIDQVKWWSLNDIEKNINNHHTNIKDYFNFVKMIINDFKHDDIEESLQASYEEHIDIDQCCPRF